MPDYKPRSREFAKRNRKILLAISTESKYRKTVMRSEVNTQTSFEEKSKEPLNSRKQTTSNSFQPIPSSKQEDIHLYPKKKSKSSSYLKVGRALPLIYEISCYFNRQKLY
jgi:hypothetical protein